MVDNARLVELFEPHVRHGDVMLSSGARSGWHFDAQQVTFGLQSLYVVSAVQGVLYEAGIEYNAIGGVELGGVPVAVLAGQGAGVKSFAVRKAAKAHGQARRIAGPLQAGDRAVLVEDVITTGTALCSAIEAVRAYGADVVAAVCLLNRFRAEMRTIAGDVPFFSLVTAGDLDLDFCDS